MAGEHVTVKVTVNGDSYSREIEPRTLLVLFIREELGLIGTHIGCDTTSCGACTVRWNGQPVKSCTVFAVQADGQEIQTVEGLEQGGQLHPIQEGFWEEHGLQCGFCTPGMMMTASALLEKTRTRAKRRSGTRSPGTCAGAPGTSTSFARSSTPRTS